VIRVALILWPAVFAGGMLFGLGWFTSFIMATTSLTVLFAGATVYEARELRKDLRRDRYT
jgi:hypothetical protein